MTFSSRAAAAAAGALAVALSTAAPALGAEAFIGVTTGNALVTLHSDSPSAVRTSVPVTGLQPGENILAIDLRPKTGQLYALGSTSRVYVVNQTSGAATALGNAFSPPLAGSAFGFDFNPAVDRIRLTSDGRQNLRLNPDDGSVAGQDATLAYAAGDPGENANPNFSAAAYTAEGKLYVIDDARDVLATTDAPNDGKMTTVGSLGIPLGGPISFDIATDGRAWVTGAAGTGGHGLFTVDLAKGGLVVSAGQRATVELRGLAAAGSVPDDKRRPSVLVAVDRDQRLRSLRRKAFGAEMSCSEACTYRAALTSGARELAFAAGEISEARRIRLRLDREGKAPKKATTATLTVVATDAAGNRTTARRRIRFR